MAILCESMDQLSETMPSSSISHLLERIGHFTNSHANESKVVLVNEHGQISVYLLR